MSLPSLIAAQVASAQKDAVRVFNEDQAPVDFDSRKITVGRDLEIKVSAPGTVVTAEIASKRPVEGPQLGSQGNKSGSSVHAAPSTESWGKPNRR